jgi:glyceraldehyde 3-phosphate dehydrogenase
MIHIAVNGFGRIGRAAFKIAAEREDINIVAINDLTDINTLAHLLRYDTMYGRYHKDVEVKDGMLMVNKKKIPVYSERDPGKLPWKKHQVDVVLECTGIFRTQELAKPHLEQAGAKAVLISAPAKSDGVGTFVFGVNAHEVNKNALVSNASCTTNCIAPIMSVLEGKFGVAKAAMTTIHSYTSDQRLVDAPHKDLRRARAAAQNIIPTTTGAAIATTKTIPELKGKFDGMAVRVPTATVSLTDITAVLKKDVTKEQVNEAFVQAAQSPILRQILAVTDEPMVSSDFIGSSYSAIVDLQLTNVIDGNLVKVIAWYDNEWGYSNRLVEMAALLGKQVQHHKRDQQ